MARGNGLFVEQGIVNAVPQYESVHRRDTSRSGRVVHAGTVESVDRGVGSAADDGGGGLTRFFSIQSDAGVRNPFARSIKAVSGVSLRA